MEWTRFKGDSRRVSSRLDYKRLVMLMILLIGIGQGRHAVATPGDIKFDPGTDFARNVEAAFNAIAPRADAMGFYLGDSRNPSLCQHYQGMARGHGAGSPLLFITLSGNPSVCPDDPSLPGQLSVIRMGSRNRHGERFGSNRIRRNRETDDTPPDLRDYIISTINFDGQNGWPNYGHPGGIELVGDVLVVPLEAPYGGGSETLVVFIDVSNPRQPQLMSTFEPSPSETFKTGLAGLHRNDDGTYLMLLSGGDNLEVRLYQSTETDLTDPKLQWTWLDTFFANPNSSLFPNLSDEPTEDEIALGGPRWPTGVGAHQTLNFVQEGGPDGDLYLVGSRDTNGGQPGGQDHFDLYKVSWDMGEFRLLFIADKHVNSHGSSTGLNANRLTSLAAAGAVHVTPSGELVLYGTEHDNDGPNGSVLMAEFRHIDLAQAFSPSFGPTLPRIQKVVSEGSIVALPGPFAFNLGLTASQPRTKAWVQLWADGHYQNRYVVIEYDNRDLDNFDDFNQLDGSSGDFENGFSDQASSLRWFAPVGCTIHVNESPIAGGADPKRALKLVGTGRSERIDHLDQVNFNNEADSVEFQSDCDEYYQAELLTEWDLDDDGEYETVDSSVEILAVDGPSIQDVRARAVHTIDSRTTETSHQVTVRNEGPKVIEVGAYNQAGNLVGFAGLAAGEPVVLKVAFSDPGLADTHTVEIDWDGTGMVTTNGLDTFEDSTNTGTGYFEASHVFQQSNIWNVSIRVTDDDGAIDARSFGINITRPTRGR